MSQRSNGKDLRLPVRAFYSVAELARAVGVPTYKLLRLMRRCRVNFLPAGRSFYVPLSEIQERIPSLWRGIVAAEELRVAVAEANDPAAGS